MRKPCIAIAFITLIVSADIIRSAPVQKSIHKKLNPFYLKALAAYKKLEPKITREDLRALIAIGILNGAKQAEQAMEKNLIDAVKDLLLSTSLTDKETILPKIERIEEQLKRDQGALEILSKSMDLAMKSKDTKTFKQEMQEIFNKLKHPTTMPAGLEVVLVQEDAGEKENNNNVAKRVAALRQHILQQMDMMKSVVDDKIDDTLDYLIDHAKSDGLLAKASNRVISKRQVFTTEEPARVKQINSLEEDDFHNNLVITGPEERNNDNEEGFIDFHNDNANENDDDLLFLEANNVIKTNSNISAVANVLVAAARGNMTLAKQEEGSPELLDNDNDGNEMAGGGGGGGGGLVGIITSLSGGEGGSDIGALIGALTGVIAQLFGPNGLDIESLLSSATALISGLLSGDKNFGTVLGIYVGTIFDGFSGGGGAINNGQFVGNFLGTVVASLSADPEEDDVPPRPILFLQNVLSSFMEAKNRRESGEDSEERKRDKKKEDDKNKDKGSDSSAFIKHVASHVVGTVVSLILNASLGASGGASHASASLFSGSSHGHKPA